jgi:peptidoglycan/xylan/chitin deacetylase (PgdA/CDA1 family)
VSMRAISVRATGLVDRRLSRLVSVLERPGLLVFVFHSLFEDRRQIGEGVVDPQESITKDDLRRVVEFFLDSGYEFVSTAQIQRGLNADGRYVHITFDDGYANNLAAVEVLGAFQVPATIFIATEHVETNRCFWWDVVYRERRKRGHTDSAVDAEVRWLKAQRYDAIDAYMESEFGSQALQPISEVDRPLTREELGELARNTWFTIGNHTRNHAILTVLQREVVRRQLNEAQRYLEGATGLRPEAVAYPNGDYNATVLEIARAVGLRVGITTDRRKNRVPFSDSDLLTLGRYIIERDVDLIDQLRISRSELQLANFGRRLLRRRRTASG